MLGEGRAGLLGLDAPKGSQPDAQRADITGNEHVFEGSQGHAAGQFDPGAVDLGDLVLQTVARQLEAVCAEGVGLDDVGTGLDVLAMHFTNHGGLGQVEAVEAIFKGDAALVQRGAHSAIGEQRARGLQGGEKAVGKAHTHLISCSTRFSPTLKYLAAGWWTMMAAVDCSGTNW